MHVGSFSGLPLPLPSQCRVRVATHNANVDAVVGYYKDVKVDVSARAQ